MVSYQTLVFPCIEILSWLIDHIDAQKCLINDENGECFGFVFPTEVHKNYKIMDPKERLNTDFMVRFYELHEINRLMAS